MKTRTVQGSACVLVALRFIMRRGLIGGRRCGFFGVRFWVLVIIQYNKYFWQIIFLIHTAIWFSFKMCG